MPGLNDEVMGPEIPKKMRGAWGEALAAAWLMERGFEVYTPIGEGMVDLFGYRLEDRRIVRVEVKTAQSHMTKAGDLRWYWRERALQMGHSDILLVVTRDGRVFDATEAKSPVRDVEIVEAAFTSVDVGDLRDIVGHATRRKPSKARARPVMDADGNRIIYD